MAMIPAPPSDPWPGRGRKGPRGRDSRSFLFSRSTPGPGPTSSNDDLLAAASFQAILSEFRASWHNGDEPELEDYLSRIRPDRPEHRIELIFEAFLLEDEAGLGPSPEEYLARFPDEARALERVLALHRGLSASRLRLCLGPGLPEPGDEIGPYRLVRELGRGGFARVFLAKQADLDDRHVVVKVSNRVTPEPRLLARAGHPHIVELYWHGLVDGGALQLLCMPFHGGATLAQVLQERRGAGRPRPRTGREFLDELDAVSAPEHHRPDSARTSRELIEALSYPRAAAWVVARLAEALDFAFERDVIHGDVKPSNVLMTAHGVPMLLDFNLSVGCRDGVDDGPGEDLGGTLAYMAPERLSNLAGPGEQPLTTTADRHRSDIYSLGMLLLELLTGKPPELPRKEGQAVALKELASAYVVSRRQGGAVMIRASQASVAGGLRAILERCLNPDPALRYRRAADLAADLDCWRNDLPTPYAREPGLLHTLARWSRRRRVALVIGSLLLAFSAAACAAVWAAAEQNWGSAYSASAQFRKLLDDSELGALQLRRQFDKATLTRDPAGRAAHHLRVYGLFEPGDWRGRGDFAYLPASDQAELEAFLLEQAVRYAHALSTRTQTPADLKRALECLDRAAGRLSIPVVEARRRALRTRLGLAEPDAKGKMESPWLENYLSGVEAELTAGPDWTEALAWYRRCLGSRPGSFFANYRAAGAAFALSKYQDACDFLSVCVAQRPEQAVLRQQYATCLQTVGKDQAASDQFDQAARTNPDYPETFLSRSYLRVKLGPIDNMQADVARYEMLRGREPNPAPLPLALLPDGLVEPDAGHEEPQTRLEPDEARVHLDLADRLVRAGHDEIALSQLDRVLAGEPENVKARFDRTVLLTKLKRDPRLIHHEVMLVVENPRVDRMVRDHPATVYAFHLAANSLLDREEIDEADEVARKGLRLSERFRSRKPALDLDLRARSHYMVALVCAKRTPRTPELLKEVLAHVKSARELSPSVVETSLPRNPVLRQIVAEASEQP